MNFGFAVIPGEDYHGETFSYLHLVETIHQAYSVALGMSANLYGCDYVSIGEILDDGTIDNIRSYKKEEIEKLMQIA
jgi:hypothetical protein